MVFQRKTQFFRPKRAEKTGGEGLECLLRCYSRRHLSMVQADEALVFRRPSVTTIAVRDTQATVVIVV